MGRKLSCRAFQQDHQLGRFVVGTSRRQVSDQVLVRGLETLQSLLTSPRIYGSICPSVPVQLPSLGTGAA